MALLRARLQYLTCTERLLLSPAPDGASWHCDAHGVAMAEVRGTVHRGDTQAVIGLFQLRVLLCRDPLLQHAWRMQKMHLHFAVGAAAALPAPPPPLALTVD